MLGDYRIKVKLHYSAQIILYQAILKVTPNPYPQDILGESLPCHLYSVIKDQAGSSQLKSHINIFLFI